MAQSGWNIALFCEADCVANLEARGSPVTHPFASGPSPREAAASELWANIEGMRARQPDYGTTRIAAAPPDPPPFALLADDRPPEVGRAAADFGKVYRVQQTMRASSGLEVWIQVDLALGIEVDGDLLRGSATAKLLDAQAQSDWGRVPDEQLARQLEIPPVRWTEAPDGQLAMSATACRGTEVLEQILGTASRVRLPQPPGPVPRGQGWRHRQLIETPTWPPGPESHLVVVLDSEHQFVGWIERGGERLALVHNLYEAHLAGAGARDVELGGYARGSSWAAFDAASNTVRWAAGRNRMTSAEGDSKRSTQVETRFVLGPPPRTPPPTSARNPGGLTCPRSS